MSAVRTGRPGPNPCGAVRAPGLCWWFDEFRSRVQLSPSFSPRRKARWRLLDKQRADRLLIMNAADGFRYQAANRQHLGLAKLRLRLGMQRNGIGGDYFFDLRVIETLAGWIGQNRMGRAGNHFK